MSKIVFEVDGNRQEVDTDKWPKMRDDLRAAGYKYRVLEEESKSTIKPEEVDASSEADRRGYGEKTFTVPEKAALAVHGATLSAGSLISDDWETYIKKLRERNPSKAAFTEVAGGVVPYAVGGGVAATAGGGGAMSAPIGGAIASQVAQRAPRAAQLAAKAKDFPRLTSASQSFGRGAAEGAFQATAEGRDATQEGLISGVASTALGIPAMMRASGLKQYADDISNMNELKARLAATKGMTTPETEALTGQISGIDDAIAANRKAQIAASVRGPQSASGAPHARMLDRIQRNLEAKKLANAKASAAMAGSDPRAARLDEMGRKLDLAGESLGREKTHAQAVLAEKKMKLGLDPKESFEKFDAPVMAADSAREVSTSRAKSRLIDIEDEIRELKAAATQAPRRGENKIGFGMTGKDESVSRWMSEDAAREQAIAALEVERAALKKGLAGDVPRSAEDIFGPPTGVTRGPKAVREKVAREKAASESARRQSEIDLVSEHEKTVRGILDRESELARKGIQLKGAKAKHKQAVRSKSARLKEESVELSGKESRLKSARERSKRLAAEARLRKSEASGVASDSEIAGLRMEAVDLERKKSALEAQLKKASAMESAWLQNEIKEVDTQYQSVMDKILHRRRMGRAGAESARESYQVPGVPFTVGRASKIFDPIEPLTPIDQMVKESLLTRSSHGIVDTARPSISRTGARMANEKLEEKKKKK